MFCVTRSEIESILKDFGIFSEIKCISELQRSHYEQEDPSSKEVRLIVKVDLLSGPSLVLRFKKETDISADFIESQCRFADALRNSGITTPLQYRSNDTFTRLYEICGRDVIVTVEQFAENGVKVVKDPGMA